MWLLYSTVANEVEKCSLAVPCFRLKAGLKLREESEKREVEKGIHLLSDPEGIYTHTHAHTHSHMRAFTHVHVRACARSHAFSFPPATAKKVRFAQQQRLTEHSREREAEMETND